MGDIIEILKSVPEVKLKVIPLTWKLLGKDGRIDIRKASRGIYRTAKEYNL